MVTYQKVLALFKKHGLTTTAMVGGTRIRGYYYYPNSGYTIRGSGRYGASEPITIEWAWEDFDSRVRGLSWEATQKLTDEKLVVAKEMLLGEGYAVDKKGLVLEVRGVVPNGDAKFTPPMQTCGPLKLLSVEVLHKDGSKEAVPKDEWPKVKEGSSTEVAIGGI